ncbi:MAG: protein-L-isoaspartate(D-aspartate) O-methyltransferase [Candidatus Bathyarchaeota archaeon]|nr:protein-L-isoaspartate(D-aspartate) O-methyltransferase [Candidatus Bathyarchaeota archaeon]
MERANWGKLIDNLTKQGTLRSPNVIKAMRAVPRTSFLPKNGQPYAASDTPVQIGFGQSISAPHMVAIMNEALQVGVGCKVLEVGAGSGWHAATIAEIIASMDAPRSEWGHIYTVETVSTLAETTRRNIITTGYGDRVTIIHADGSKGYPEKAPYDRILVTAAAPKIPKPLVDQLKSGGILLVPVGSPFLFQNLTKLTKQADGKIVEENLGGVSFVPLRGEFGHQMV